LTDFLSSAHLKSSSIISTLPFYFQRWLATEDSDDEEDTHQPPTVDRYPMDGTDHECFTLRHGLGSPSKSDDAPLTFYGSSTTRIPLDPDQLFDDEESDFASKYLNLDYGTSPVANRTVAAEIGSPTTSSDSSASFSGTPVDVETQWGAEPTSLSLLNTTKFEIEIDANGAEKRNPWPWGNYTYRPLGRPRYIDSDEYVQKHEFMKAEEKLRTRLTELFAEEAVRAGKGPKVERRRETKPSEDAKRGTSMPIIAFSQLVRGRTIYNP